MSFFYLFLGASHFTLLVFTLVKYCYYFGVLTRKYILSKLSINDTVVTTVNTIVRPSSRINIRIPGELDNNNNTSNTETESESDYDTDDDYDSDDDIDIETREVVYEETDKINGKCYIGIAYLDKHHGVYLMNGTISTRSFFQFAYHRIVAYTRHISVYYTSSSSKQLEILKLHIQPNCVYEVSIHTFWIRIIQRAWRKTYAQRKLQIRIRGNIRNQESFRNTGRYMYGSRVLPSIHGILSNTK